MLYVEATRDMPAGGAEFVSVIFALVGLLLLKRELSDDTDVTVVDRDSGK